MGQCLGTYGSVSRYLWSVSRYLWVSVKVLMGQCLGAYGSVSRYLWVSV